MNLISETEKVRIFKETDFPKGKEWNDLSNSGDGDEIQLTQEEINHLSHGHVLAIEVCSEYTLWLKKREIGV